MKFFSNIISFPYPAYMLYRVGLILFLGLLFSSCKKEKCKPVEENLPFSDCIEIPPADFVGTGYEFILDTLYFGLPVFNPNNPDEIIFNHRRENNVYKLNMRTGEHSIILNFPMISVDWGVNDWILLTYNQMLWKVKSNGDSLTQITTSLGFHSSWNPEGTLYIYSTGTNEPTLIANTNDVVIDTLPISFNAPSDWTTNNQIAFSNSLYIMGDTVFTTYNTEGYLGEPVWINENEFLLTNSEGLNLINTITGQISDIRRYRNCLYYLNPSYSPQINKLVMTKIYRELLPDGRTIYAKSDCVMMNPDGTQEEVIDIASFLYE